VPPLLSILYTANPGFTRYGDRPAFPDERIVIIACPMFTHKISIGYDVNYTAAITQVNGVRNPQSIGNLPGLTSSWRISSTGSFFPQPP
jgi:hypothetical protein